MNVLTAAKRAVLVLNRSGVDYALCGGLAVGVHGYVRATDDIDVVVADRPAAQHLCSLLAEDGWIINPACIDFPDGFTLYRAILADTGPAIPLDILIPPQGVDVLTGRHLSEVDSCACWVIAKAKLLDMKRSAGRPQDLLDISKLTEAAL